MFDIGQHYPESGKEEQRILNFHVTTNWNKVPKPIRDNFPDIPAEVNVLYSKFVDWIYIAPPKKTYSLMMIKRDGKQIYVSQFIEDIAGEIEREHDYNELSIDPMLLVVLMGLLGITLFVITILTIFKKIALPVESLQLWAKELEINELEEEIPDFRFKELNSLARLIHQNLASVANSIKREQRFLSYASHELRTPIAVLRSNSALLEKISPEPSEKERVIRDRIQRASLKMKSMTETLLWLSREGETEMPVESVILGSLVENIQQELKYLLAGKSVDVSLDIDKTSVDLALTPSVIVLNNLIRNAFQHTQYGQVTILQKSNIINITNIESATQSNSQVNDELGFGLGMQLVEKLAEQFGWCYTADKLDNGYTVSVIFTQ